MKASKVIILRNQLYHLLLWYGNRSEGFRKRCNNSIWEEAQKTLFDTDTKPPKRSRVVVEGK